MWYLVKDLFLIVLGIGIGILILALVQVGSNAEKRIEEMENERSDK